MTQLSVAKNIVYGFFATICTVYCLNIIIIIKIILFFFIESLVCHFYCPLHINCDNIKTEGWAGISSATISETIFVFLIT